MKEKDEIMQRIKNLQGNTFYFPHEKQAKGMVYLDDDEDAKKAGVPSTIRIHPYARIDLTGDLHVGSWSMIAAGVRIITHEHRFERNIPRLAQDKEKTLQVMGLRIGKDVWIYQSIILPRCRFIADGVTIGAGSVVTRSIDIPFSTWAGNPARMQRIEKLEDCPAGEE